MQPAASRPRHPQERPIVTAGDAAAAPAPPPANLEPSDAGPLLERAREALGHGKPTESFLLALRARMHHLIGDVDAALAARAHRRRQIDEGR